MKQLMQGFNGQLSEKLTSICLTISGSFAETKFFIFTFPLISVPASAIYCHLKMYSTTVKQSYHMKYVSIKVEISLSHSSILNTLIAVNIY